jgi:hypothetical protein
VQIQKLPGICVFNALQDMLRGKPRAHLVLDRQRRRVEWEKSQVVHRVRVCHHVISRESRHGLKEVRPKRKRFEIRLVQFELLGHPGLVF